MLWTTTTTTTTTTWIIITIIAWNWITGLGELWLVEMMQVVTTNIDDTAYTILRSFIPMHLVLVRLSDRIDAVGRDNVQTRQRFNNRHLVQAQKRNQPQHSQVCAKKKIGDFLCLLLLLFVENENYCRFTFLWLISLLPPPPPSRSVHTHIHRHTLAHTTRSELEISRFSINYEPRALLDFCHLHVMCHYMYPRVMDVRAHW